jgi:hypothetical protein
MARPTRMAPPVTRAHRAILRSVGGDVIVDGR